MHQCGLTQEQAEAQDIKDLSNSPLFIKLNSDRASQYLMRDAIRALGNQCQAVVESNRGVSEGVKVEPILGAAPVSLRALSALVNACHVLCKAREVLGNAVIVSFLYQMTALRTKKANPAKAGLASNEQWELWKFNQNEFADATSSLQNFVHDLESFAQLEDIESSLRVHFSLHVLFSFERIHPLTDLVSCQIHILGAFQRTANAGRKIAGIPTFSAGICGL